MTLHQAIQDARAGKIRSLRCPAHEDHSPSLSVRLGKDGRVLIHCFTGCTPEAVLTAGGLTWDDLFEEGAIRGTGPGWTNPSAKHLPPWDEPDRIAKRSEWPLFQTPTAAELEQIGRIRGLRREGLELAVARGILRVTTYENGHRCWVITDSARVVGQVRRLDGLKFRRATSEEKALSLPGSTHKWPAGIAALKEDYRSILLTEGGPDLLTAFHFIAREGRERDATAIGILGAGCEIHEDLLHRFKGRRVRIAQHADKAGDTAVKRWARQLQPYAAQLDKIWLEGLRKHDGHPVEDLNDLAHVHADDFEKYRWIWNLTP